jgi:ubiquinone/menaquinone biosynthesis C-methylase UbiE
MPMSFYSTNMLPRLMDWSMSGSIFTQYREQVLANVDGEVLEIGFGTGLNLNYYPNQVQKITTIDSNSGMNNLARRRIATSSISVDSRLINGENLPMLEGTYDSVVSTWTLCSIAKVEVALTEIYRVLKPNGKFFFIEHGLSNDPKIQVWQRRLTPFQKIIGDGCHLDRNIRYLLENQFSEISIKEFQAEGLPKVGSYFYQGVATKI